MSSTLFTTAASNRPTGAGFFASLFIAVLTASCGSHINVGEDCHNSVCTDCNASNCDDGCCLGGRCYSPQAASCGVNGSQCVDCSDRGDECSDEGVCLCGGIRCNESEICEEGQCLCGSQPGCSDFGDCVDGECRCGDGAQCADGQRCDAGRCVCDDFSCEGCCWGGITCQVEPSNEACGRYGGACVVCLPGEECLNGECLCGGEIRCSPDLAETCREGQCLCGSVPGCELGQLCIEGECRCNGESCPEGCCHHDECREPSVESCGWRGSPCEDCRLSADTCTTSDHSCRCGDGPPCSPGRVCVEGACL